MSKTVHKLSSFESLLYPATIFSYSDRCGTKMRGVSIVANLNFEPSQYACLNDKLLTNLVSQVGFEGFQDCTHL